MVVASNLVKLHFMASYVSFQINFLQGIFIKILGISSKKYVHINFILKLGLHHYEADQLLRILESSGHEQCYKNMCDSLLAKV